MHIVPNYWCKISGVFMVVKFPLGKTKARFECMLKWQDFFLKHQTVILVHFFGYQMKRNCILLPKLFWPTVRKNCSSNREKLLKNRGWRSRICKIFEITRTIYLNSEKSEQFLVTECFFNLFLEVSQVW